MLKISRKVYRFTAKTILVIAILALVMVGVFVGLQVSGKSRLYKGREENISQFTANIAGNTAGEEGVQESSGREIDWEEGDVRYKGIHYRYNDEILTFLFMGIDRMEEVKEAKNDRDGGQADALFLVIMDPRDKEISVIGINRNTMVDIEVYGEGGGYQGTGRHQIALQHGFGDGAELSCERTVNVVSNLFYGLNIDGYCAVNMGAIALLNDTIGGVELTAIEDVPKSSIKEGQKILLKGQDAYAYLHNREMKTAYGADKRLKRQTQYIQAYAKKAVSMTKEDFSLPVKLFNTLKKYMVTDISMDEVSYLVTRASDYSFREDAMYTLKGETAMDADGRFAEFTADEEALYELILQVFYYPVEDKE